MKATKTKIVELPQEWPGALHYGEEVVAAMVRFVRSGSPFRFYGIDFQYKAKLLEKEFAAYFYNISSLTKKKSICGHHSVWELEENAFAMNYSYEKGTLPVLDDYTERTVLFCITSKLTDVQKDTIKYAFIKTCDKLLS